MTRKRKTIIIISLLLFISLVVLIKTTTTNFLDNKVYSLISNNLIKDNITPIVKTLTYLSSAIFLISLTILLSIIIRNKKLPLFIIINLASSYLLNNILKLIFRRDRPSMYNLITEKGYSFPSGHSMVSFAYYGLLIYLIYKYIDNKVLKYILIFILTTIILLVGLSRIYLGVHYTTDVLGGYIFGLLYLIIFINYIEKYLTNGG